MRGFGGFRKGGRGVSKHQETFGTSKDETRLTSKLLHFLLLSHMLHTRRHTVWGLWGLWCVSLELWASNRKEMKSQMGKGEPAISLGSSAMFLCNHLLRGHIDILSDTACPADLSVQGRSLGPELPGCCTSLWPEASVHFFLFTW